MRRARELDFRPPWPGGERSRILWPLTSSLPFWPQWPMPWACCGVSPIWNTHRGPACLGSVAMGALSLISSCHRPTGYLADGKVVRARPWEAPAAPSLRPLGPPEVEALLGPGRKQLGQSQVGLPLAAPLAWDPRPSSCCDTWYVMALGIAGCHGPARHREPREITWTCWARGRS